VIKVKFYDFEHRDVVGLMTKLLYWGTSCI